MTIRPISSNLSFQGRLDASAQRLFAKKVKNVDFANLNIGKKAANQISVSYNIKPNGKYVTTMYVTDTSKITNPFVSVELAKGKKHFNENLLDLIKKNISKAEKIQAKYL